MKAAIIGAGKNNSGIGRYISKFFQLNGSDLVAVLGTTIHTSTHAAKELESFGIKASSFTSFEDMISKEDPDAVAIASPYETHLDYLGKCIEAGIHVFCEKPFIWPINREVLGLVKELLEQAAKKELIVCMNSQWPFCLPWYEKLCGKLRPEEIEMFEIYMEPPGTGLSMIPDAAPHALSLLYSVLGAGKIERIKVAPGLRKAEISFDYHSNYGNCSIVIEFASNHRQPRDFRFGFNGRAVSRIIDPETYSLRFSRGTSQCPVVDPLNLSVKDFIEAIVHERPPLIGPRHILDTTEMLYDLYCQCECFWRKDNEITS